MAFQTKTDFLNAIVPLANKYGSQYNIDPNLIISQAALETGWGKSAPNNNFFGIKGTGGVQTTQEYVGGQMVTVQDSFKGYSSLEDSVKGYATFLTTNPRYSDVFGKTGSSAIDAVASAGYATDPNYASKLKNISNNVTLSTLGSSLQNGIAKVTNTVKTVSDIASTVSGFKDAGAALAKGDIAGAAAAIGGAAQNAASSTASAVANATGATGLFDWLQNIFSVKTATRFIAIALGIGLVIVAIIFLTGTDKVLVAGATKGAAAAL